MTLAFLWHGRFHGKNEHDYTFVKIRELSDPEQGQRRPDSFSLKLGIDKPMARTPTLAATRRIPPQAMTLDPQSATIRVFGPASNIPQISTDR